MADKKIRVRYAPSPTGHLHIGNARTALFNYLFARHNNGAFVIRIEDTDTKRNVEGGEESQLTMLKWLGMDWDEGPDKPGDVGPYRQSERKDIYLPLIQQLVDQGLAYESYVTEDELATQREAQKARHEMPHYVDEYAGLNADEKAAKIAAAKAKGVQPVIRFKVPVHKKYEFDDMVKGHIEFDSDSIGGDFVILKRDGMPTYNFAVVVDDHLMKITHVLRGDDHIANTPKQLMIYEALGWEAPVFGHMTLIINTKTGKKLSKRDEDTLQFIEQYRELGYLPEGMFNFITLLGWSPVGEDEIFNQKQLIKMFDPNRLSRSPAKFDAKKLEWVNNQYMKQTPSSRVTDMVIYQLIKAGRLPADPDSKTIEWARTLTSLYHDQMSYASQVVEESEVFFNEPPQLDEAALKEMAAETAPTVLKTFYKLIQNVKIFDATEINATIQAVRGETGVKGRQLYMPIRIATTRASHGPQIAEAIELLGREKALHHIQVTMTELGIQE